MPNLDEIEAVSEFLETKAQLQNGRKRLVEAYRNYAQIKWKKPLYAKSRQMLLDGRYPFERAWYTESEISALKSILSKRYRATMFDLGLIFGAAVLLNLLLYVIIFFVLDAP